VPFLKFSRDRRGYENFYLVESVTGRRGKTRQRVLYWYRTPPNVRVGREPFDPHVRRALEARYPDVRFDWAQIRNTPIPSVEPEYWRERRRMERVVRRQQEDEDAMAAAMPPTSDPGPPEADPGPPEVVPPDPAEAIPAVCGLEAVVETPNAVPAHGRRPTEAVGEGPGSRRRRRRRRGQRNPNRPNPIGAPLSAERDQTESSTAASIDASELTEDEFDPDD
jgi:hypothetical protein